MGVKGDLFELLSQAPDGLRSLQGSLREWRHVERFRRGLDQLSEGSGGRIAIAGFGRGEPPSDTVDVVHQVWTVLPDRWRVESADRFDVSDGTRRWTGSAHQFMELDEEAPDLESTVLGRVMRTGSLLGALKFGDLEQDEVAGRRCWRVDAQAAPSNFLRPRMLAVRLGGVDHTLWFDAETGIMLRHIGMFDGQPAVDTEFLEVITNQPIDPGRFQFRAPPGSVVRRATDGLIEMAERHGVDLTDVDRSDPKAVRQALHEGMNHPQPFAEPTKEAKRAKHIPVDSPPADETAAHAAIVYAFEHSGETAQDGTSLVHVQHGHGLSDLLDQARRRVPGVAAGSVGTVVEDVMFLGPDHAVVWFSVVADGNRVRMASGIEGRALLVEGQWVIEHATFIDLIGRGGMAYLPRG
jgi:hypothetical protein